MTAAIDIDGLSGEEWLALPPEEFDALVSVGPVLFRVGTAEVLAELRVAPDGATIILGHIDGGGEGVLLRLWVLARALCHQRGWSRLEWVVHAATCARPNRKLQRMLALKGFQVVTLDEHGKVYHLVDHPQGTRT